MRFLRDNLFYVVLAGLTLVVGAVEVGYALSGRLGAQIKRRQDVSDRLLRLRRTLDAAQISEAKVEALSRRIGVIKAAVRADEDAAVEFNRRNLEVIRLPAGGTVPEPVFPFDAAKFQVWRLYYPFTVQYRTLMKALLADERLGAVAPPTPADVDKRAEQIKNPMITPQEARRQAKARVVLERAKEGRIYAAPEALEMVFPEPVSDAKDDKLWEAQVNLWVTQEIVRAIIATNEEIAAERKKAGDQPAEQDILTSAVRHLLKVHVEQGTGGAGATAFGAAVLEPADLTRRRTDSRCLVVPYTFSVVMPTRYVERLLRNLELQNYHCVLRTSMAAVPYSDTSLVYYGPEAVMNVDVSGQLLLLRKWINPLLPKSVAERLPS